jgi:hypothetical protein
MSDGPAANAFRRNVLLSTALVAVVGLAALVAWARVEAERDSMFCTLAGAIGTPVRDSPDAAFDSWWDARGPREAASAANYDGTSPDVDPPTKDDFDRRSHTEWRWYRGSGRAVQIDVYESPDGWYVGGVNACTSGGPGPDLAP